ncbi:MULTISPECIES: hypothetical protein [Streptomyces]|uniref:RdlA protein n=1 Tax=Streptomyces griseofuscus TaxID=146922 RepID=A0A7H1Q1V6_9ACTN|nr:MULTISPECIES: hypothetical protein [Streptomyces]MBA9046812.1 hypothetical protein [Streptomyces murinus]QNT94286.1 hypothetical protein HEP81_03994 [Streptomyces griseofuscus]BBC94958.1 hypothetical protein SRO_3782 [Streptomyces rochei]
MKLAKRFTAISVAVTAAILFSAGGAQAQSGGGLLSLLGDIPLLRMPFSMGTAGPGDSSTGTQTNNNNNNNTGGPNNNNNNNGGGTNNNNNNNNGDSQAQADGAGILSLLGKSLINFQVCYPKGQVGSGNTFTGNQNINCHQN